MENITISNGKFIHFTDTLTNIKNFDKHWKNVLKNLTLVCLIPFPPPTIRYRLFSKKCFANNFEVKKIS